MASFRLEFKASAERDIRRISASLVPNIIQRIESLREEPFPRQSLKLSGAEEMHRLRAGVYRVVYEVDLERQLIRVHYVRHRRDAYRDL